MAGGSGQSFGFDFSNDFQGTARSGGGTTQKQISQEGVNKLIYDALSSDQGLAALGGVENASGGFKSSTKSLLSQDLISKLVGELANVTAPTVKTDYSNEKTSKDSSNIKAGTVICTELVRQDKLDIDLYSAGHAHFLSLHPAIIRGYQLWAAPIAIKMATSPRLTRFFVPLARKRYEYIVYDDFSIFGFLSVYLGQPLCFLIGLLVPKRILPAPVPLPE